VWQSLAARVEQQLLDYWVQKLMLVLLNGRVHLLLED
jgi:hypothetical protein